MVTITRTAYTIQVEKYLRPALPDPNSYNGDEFLVNFQYQYQSKAKVRVHDQVFTAKFIKQKYIFAKRRWKWVYRGITD